MFPSALRLKPASNFKRMPIRELPRNTPPTSPLGDRMVYLGETKPNRVGGEEDPSFPQATICKGLGFGGLGGSHLWACSNPTRSWAISSSRVTTNPLWTKTSLAPSTLASALPDASGTRVVGGIAFSGCGLVASFGCGVARREGNEKGDLDR